jgi:hypothetical protein
MSEEERDSRGYPIKHFREAVLFLMENRGYPEDLARGVVEAQYDEDMKIFACIDGFERYKVREPEPEPT